MIELMGLAAMLRSGVFSAQHKNLLEPLQCVKDSELRKGNDEKRNKKVNNF